MKVNIDQVSDAFTDWRLTRTKRSHTPSHLQEQAVSLVGMHSKLQITTRLGINNKMLDRWINNSNNNSLNNTFIDITPTEINHHKPLEVAVQCGCGTTLKLTGDAAEIATVILKLQNGGGL